MKEGIQKIRDYLESNITRQWYGMVVVKIWIFIRFQKLRLRAMFLATQGPFSIQLWYPKIILKSLMVLCVRYSRQRRFFTLPTNTYFNLLNVSPGTPKSVSMFTKTIGRSSEAGKLLLDSKTIISPRSEGRSPIVSNGTSRPVPG